MNRDRKIAIIFMILGFMLLVFFLYSSYLRRTSRNMCSEECDNLGALDSNIILNGEFNTKDLCVCYFKDSIKSFRLNNANP